MLSSASPTTRKIFFRSLVRTPRQRGYDAIVVNLELASGDDALPRALDRRLAALAWICAAELSDETVEAVPGFPF